MNGSSCSATEALGDQGKLGGSNPPSCAIAKLPSGWGRAGSTGSLRPEAYARRQPLADGSRSPASENQFRLPGSRPWGEALLEGNTGRRCHDRVREPSRPRADLVSLLSGALGQSAHPDPSAVA
jgi:hypothetical protein